jgi:hypothetical protein
MGARGMMGILRPVSYWRKWEPVDRDLGGGFAGVAVLECGHVERVREVKAKGLRYGNSDQGRKLDDMGRPAQCWCIECRVARDRA